MDRLIHIADLHFWEIVWNPLRLLNKRLLGNANVLLRRHKEFLVDRAEAYADAVAATGASTALLTGDFTSTSTAREFKAGAAFACGLEARGLRVWAIPGNHDVYTFESTRKRRFEKHLGRFLPEGGLPARVNLPGGTPLVLVPTVCPNLISSRGRITGVEAAAAARMIDECPPGPILVAGHYPVLHKTGAYESSWGRRLRNAGALHAALARAKGPLLYLAGHVHRFSYVSDPVQNRVFHLTTPAFFLHRHGQSEEGAFTEIRIVDNMFEAIQYTYDGIWRSVRAVPDQGVFRNLSGE